MIYDGKVFEGVNNMNAALLLGAKNKLTTNHQPLTQPLVYIRGNTKIKGTSSSSRQSKPFKKKHTHILGVLKLNLRALFVIPWTDMTIAGV